MKNQQTIKILQDGGPKAKELLDNLFNNIRERARSEIEKNFVAWFEKSEGLNKSAEILSGEILNGKKPGALLIAKTCYPVFLMLRGLEIECLLKEYYVHKFKRFDIKKLKKHDLLKLGTLVGIKLNSNQISLLEILSSHIEWEGKYPAPLGIWGYERTDKTRTRFKENIGLLKQLKSEASRIKTLIKKINQQYEREFYKD